MQTFTSLPHLLAKLQVTSPLVCKPEMSSKAPSSFTNSLVAGNCIMLAAWLQPVVVTGAVMQVPIHRAVRPILWR